MCYRCEVCGSVVPKRTPRLTHTIQRRVLRMRLNGAGELVDEGRLEIARELAVCKRCHKRLLRGDDLRHVLRTRQPRVKEVSATPKPRPLPEANPDEVQVYDKGTSILNQ